MSHDGFLGGELEAERGTSGSEQANGREVKSVNGMGKRIEAGWREKRAHSLWSKEELGGGKESRKEGKRSVGCNGGVGGNSKLLRAECV